MRTLVILAAVALWLVLLLVHPVVTLVVTGCVYNMAIYDDYLGRKGRYRGRGGLADDGAGWMILAAIIAFCYWPGPALLACVLTLAMFYAPKKT